MTALALAVADDSTQPTVWITTGADDPAPFPLLTRSEVVLTRVPVDAPGAATRNARAEMSERLWDAITEAATT